MEEDSSSREGVRPTAAVQRQPVTRLRVHSKYILPSDRHPFSVHFDVLRRFVTLSRNGAEPISAERVEGEGVPVQAASMNVRFLASVGLLRFDSKGLYLPTAETIRFIGARSVGEDRARPILRAVLATSWFAELAESVLKTRPVISEEQFVGELALAAETDKARKEPALRVLVEYLAYSGILNRDESGLSMGPTSPSAASPESGLLTPLRTNLDARSRPNVSDSHLGGGNLASSEGSGWHTVQTEDYYLKIRSSPEVLDELTEQLGLLRKKILRLRAGEMNGGDSGKPPA